MTIEMKVPAVGESVTQVTIATWLKKDGDFVNPDEVLCELESDKATFELPSEAAGFLRIAQPAGMTLNIGEVICRIEVPDEQGTKPAPVAPAPETKTPAAAPVVAAPVAAAPAAQGQKVVMTVPPVGESITEVTLASWLKKEGDLVKMDETICEIESDKATFEIGAKATGILHLLALDKRTLKIGDPICEITITEGTAQVAAPAAEPVAQTAAPVASPGNYATGTASPAAGKILTEKGISPATVSGTGKDGRITKEDALNAQPKVTPPAPKAEPVAKPEPKAEAQPLAPVGTRNERREKMSSLRKTVARRLVAVKNETAMLTTFNEVNMKPIMDLRAKYKDAFKEKHGVGLGFMSFFVRAVCLALREFPAVNAAIDGEDIVYHDYVDISIAVSAPKGLVVPVVRNAEALGFADIEAEIGRLATRARDNKLTIPEMTGGTFTITNGGVFGSLMSTPIINAPQVAILGMHNIVERAVVEAGQVVVRPMMYIALSYDHRIIDGRESVSFLVRVKQLLEDPARMLLLV
ncbi:MAG: 2-oxoglutarate dehydrogenase complex dihydrolipoyllysine-residue succinyltransferase [Bernardetiaceae bacterium]|nr:2-oxoglutarate dehydrogenase complex dihydrolipoyllysine-residue succinyltransferase [Bernardetiaceae bacterium]